MSAYLEPPALEPMPDLEAATVKVGVLRLALNRDRHGHAAEVVVRMPVLELVPLLFRPRCHDLLGGPAAAVLALGFGRDR